MNQMNIVLKTLQEVYEFVRIASKSACTIDVGSGRHIVDGKSILGVLSLNCSTGVTVTYHGTDEQRESFKLALEVFN